MGVTAMMQQALAWGPGASHTNTPPLPRRPQPPAPPHSHGARHEGLRQRRLAGSSSPEMRPTTNPCAGKVPRAHREPLPHALRLLAFASARLVLALTALPGTSGQGRLVALKVR